MRPSRGGARSWRPGAAFVGSALILITSFTAPLTASASSEKPQSSSLNLNGTYPVGVPDTSEPSGDAPPSATALTGYSLTYVNDFLGTTIPPGWDVFTGVPGSDPGGHFGISHVVVSDGMLELNTYRDPAWGNRWVTGGLCQCGVARRYGAYFVRSRYTAAGPNEAELLWPAGKVWPPEIDFNETGGSVTTTTTSVHFGKKNTIVRSEVNINMTQWHTWGVIWTPTLITFTVDGTIWGTFNVASEISKVPMTLDFEQRQICEEHRQCPTKPTSMQIDWVAEYALTPLS
jgi:hypothetical protein